MFTELWICEQQCMQFSFEHEIEVFLSFVLLSRIPKIPSSTEWLLISMRWDDIIICIHVCTYACQQCTNIMYCVCHWLFPYSRQPLLSSSSATERTFTIHIVSLKFLQLLQQPEEDFHLKWIEKYPSFKILRSFYSLPKIAFIEWLRFTTNNPLIKFSMHA